MREVSISIAVVLAKTVTAIKVVAQNATKERLMQL